MPLAVRIRAHLGARLTEYPTREAWSADRGNAAPRWSLGGTDAASILGVGWGNQWSVWASGQGEPAIDEPSDVMLRGSEWEPIVLEWYRRHHGRETWAPLCRVASPDAPWLRPSPDAFAVDHDFEGGHEIGLVEIKCPRLRDGWGEDGAVASTAPDAAGLMPLGYAVQVYAQLAASGLSWCDLVACWGPQDTRTIRIVADPAYQSWLVATLAERRDLHLVRGERPDIDASSECGSWLGSLTREGVRAATPEEAEEMTAILQLRRDGEQAVEEAKVRARKIAVGLGEIKSIYGGGCKLVVDTRGAVRIT